MVAEGYSSRAALAGELGKSAPTFARSVSQIHHCPSDGRLSDALPNLANKWLTLACNPLCEKLCGLRR